MATFGGTIFDAVRKQVSLAIEAATDLTGWLRTSSCSALALLAMCIASIVFVYFSAIGQIQAAFGIVLGPIALALGFSSYTRNYFVKWLDWMISAGMYVVVGRNFDEACRVNSIANAVDRVTQRWRDTTVNGALRVRLGSFLFCCCRSRFPSWRRSSVAERARRAPVR